MVNRTPIELAPNWKRSLTLVSPLILASGAMTAPSPASLPGEEQGRSEVGAIVTAPLTLHARRGAPLPRVVGIPGGCLIRTGAANIGLVRAARENERAWAASPCPIIVAFAAQGAHDWAVMAARLEGVTGIGGIELHLNPTIDVRDAVRATRAATEVPLLAMLDLDSPLDIAARAVTAGANALVVGRPPRGMALVDGRAWFGRLYSPSVKPIALRAVADIAAQNLDVPIVASGGIHSVDDVRDFLSAGAAAVEVDSAMWIDPETLRRLLDLRKVGDTQ